MSIFPISIRLSFALKSLFFDEEINTTIITCEIILGILFLAILSAFTHWSSSLISQSPIFGNGQIPSHLITDSSFLMNTQLVDIINICVCIIGKSDFSIIIFLFIAFTNSIYKLVFVIRYPFLSIFHSALVASISFSDSIFLIVSIFQLIHPKFSDGFLLLASIFSLISSFIFFYYFISYLDMKKREIIISGEFDKIDPSSIPAYFQVAVINGILSTDFIEFISENHPDTNSPQYLITMLISEKVDLKQLSEMIIPIFNINELTFSQKYLIYQIYLKSLHGSEDTVEFQGLNNIQSRMQTYDQSSDDFWTLMLLGKTNKALKLVQNNETFLTKLLRDYNLYYKACPQNKTVINLHKNFFYNFVKTPDVDVFQTDNQELADPNDYTSQTIQMSYNLKKALERHTPIFLILFRLVGYLCFIVFVTASMFPIFQLSNDSSVLLNLSPALNHSLNIALMFSKINLAIGNAVNCSAYLHMSCDDILSYLFSKNGEPPGVECHSMLYFYDHMLDLANDLLARLNEMTNQFSNLFKNSYISDLLNSWSKPTVTLFPNSDIESIRSIKVDIKSALTLLASQIKEISSFSHNDRCNSQLLDIIRPDANEILNRSSQLQISINNSLQYYYKYIKALVDSGARFFNPTEIFLMLLFGFASLAIPIACTLLFKKRSYNILNKYFRPSTHPNKRIQQYLDIQRSNIVDPFKYGNSYKRPLIIWSIVIIITFIISLLLSNHLTPAYDVMMNESQMLICMERLASYISTITDTIMRNWLFPNEESVLNLFNILRKDLLISMNEFYDSMSPELIQHFRKNASIMDRKCEITSRSNHDIYSCNNFIQQCELYFFLFNSHNISNASKSVSLHISHLYMTHISNGFIDLGDLFTKYSLETRESFLALILFGLIFYFAILLITFSLTLSEIFRILHLQRQISRLFLVLPPTYVACNNCLMNYVTDKEEPINNSISDSFLTFYDNAGIALIMLNEHLSIVSFTQAVQHLFSYRAEQLIGQPIDLLFPKKIESNDIKFYQHINILKKKQAENAFSRSLIGKLSYGGECHIKVKVTAFNLNESEENSIYFILDCTSETEFYSYDEGIIQHAYCLENIFNNSVPLNVFPNFSQENEVIKQHFDNFALVYVFSMDNTDSQLASTLPYFRGLGDSVIFYYTNYACLIFFVDITPDYIYNAVQFFNLFGKNSCGFIVEGNNIDFLAFPFPSLPDDYAFSYSAIPMEALKMCQSSMTIEPVGEIMTNVAPLVRLCKKGKLICTNGVLGFYENSNYQMIENNLGVTLFSIDI